MRRYMQGTLDFACGIYAVINALSCMHGLDLAGARKIFQETMLVLSRRETLWDRFLRNETDHYWLVRWMVWRWCLEPSREVTILQPFSDCLLPPQTGAALEEAALYLPEAHEPAGPACSAAASREAESVWEAMESWFAAGKSGSARTALLRFHRFIPGTRQPVVSHWTTAHAANAGAVLLHDASSEPGALFSLERKKLLPEAQTPAMLRIVPESILFLEPAKRTGGLWRWRKGL